MVVKIITDSTADIPSEIAEELNIAVIPVYVRFGETVYRDGLDLDHQQFYELLAVSSQHPATSQPTPEDFARLYRDNCLNRAGIISIHISARISGTCSSALLGKKQAGITCPIEVIDSGYNSMGLGLLAIEAAKLSAKGACMAEVVKEIRVMMSKTRMLGVFNTLKYAIAGGRINRATGKVGSLLNVKPIFTFREGEVKLVGISRTYSKAMDKLFDFVKTKNNIRAISIAYSEISRDALKLAARIDSLPNHGPIIITELGAALGAHGGPGVLLVALIES
jgi:DegV family protein with EDD domain